MVPTSAISGEGISDLLQLMVKLTQTMMGDRLTLLDETQCTVRVCVCVCVGGGGWAVCFERCASSPHPLHHIAHTPRHRFLPCPDSATQVLEVKTLEGLGTTIDVVLINGHLREGDRIVACGLQGPIVTRIKALKTPQVGGWMGGGAWLQ